MSQVSRFAKISCFLFGFVGFAATLPPAKPLKIPTLQYEEYKLPNGLQVLHASYRLPLVALDLWYHVGPANEKAGRTGFAHLFEHMMFEGSEHVGEKAHFRYLEGAGRNRHQRHDRFRPDQLLRDSAKQPTGARTLARKRPHGISARDARPAEARPTSATLSVTSAGKVKAARTLCGRRVVPSAVS